jgi:hypothetical protein
MSAGSFIVARYSAKGASSLYAGYGMGSAGLFVAAVVNPHSGYREMVGGVVSTLSWREQALTLALAIADATDAQYVQAYVVPNLVKGRFQFSGTIEWYEPLESEGVHQLDVNPLTLAYTLVSGLRLGASYTLAWTEGDETAQRAGPVLQVGIPRGQVYGEVLRRFQHHDWELRIGSQLGF